MLLSDRNAFDFAMTYYNSDGHESTMCGNGGRCMTAFARSLGLVKHKTFFQAIDGVHEAEIIESSAENIYKLKMKDTKIGKLYDDGILIDTGSPHFVRYVKDASNTDVVNLGRMFRHDARFAPGGANVNFVEIQDDGLFVRTYERGVENETLSCGTGVTASALIHAFGNPGNRGFYHINTLGGALKVSFLQNDDQFTEVWLEGPAKFVFEGEIEI
jgi:diaminopimelate epimerase